MERIGLRFLRFLRSLMPAKVLSKRTRKILRRRINQKIHQHYGIFDAGDENNPADEWMEPNIRWDHCRAEKFFKCIPFDKILKSPVGDILIDFLSDLLDWTIQKNSPPLGDCDQISFIC